ncbi:hypothetical protein [Natrinema salinisoli]|uniref:hypothetical protein n=1 Tax=Natrinema salinisoli TaxID=2878535 RepID=UPI001CEFCD1E|nr:hypothetical protein [Natrinema salinisoli]
MTATDVDELDDLLQYAFKQGQEVGLVPAEDYGIHVTIDGVSITETRNDRDEGLPWEHFEMWANPNPSPAAQKKIDELVQWFIYEHIDTSGDVPRLHDSGVPIEQIRIMHEEGLYTHQIVDWLPDSVNFRQVKAAVAYIERSQQTGDAE